MKHAGFKRADRVAELILREIALIIQRHVKDPRVRGVGITAVNLSEDLKQARIFFTLDAPADPQSIKWQGAKKGLQSAKGFIKRQLSLGLALRSMPELIFKEDFSEGKAHRVEELLRTINKPNNSE